MLKCYGSFGRVSTLLSTLPSGYKQPGLSVVIQISTFLVGFFPLDYRGKGVKAVLFKGLLVRKPTNFKMWVSQNS